LLEGKGHTILAAVWLAEGRTDAALRDARQALDLHRATGYRLGEAGTLLVLGYVLDHDGDADAAVAHWQDALAILTLSAPPTARRSVRCSTSAGPGGYVPVPRHRVRPIALV